MPKTASVETFRKVLDPIVLYDLSGVRLPETYYNAIKVQAMAIRNKMTLQVMRSEGTKKLVVYCLYSAYTETGIAINIDMVMTQLGIPKTSKSTCITLFAGKGHIPKSISTEDSILERIRGVAPLVFERDPTLHVKVIETIILTLAGACQEISTSDPGIIAAAIIILYCENLKILINRDQICESMNVKVPGVLKKCKCITRVFNNNSNM